MHMHAEQTVCNVIVINHITTQAVRRGVSKHHISGRNGATGCTPYLAGVDHQHRVWQQRRVQCGHRSVQPLQHCVACVDHVAGGSRTSFALHGVHVLPSRIEVPRAAV